MRRVHRRRRMPYAELARWLALCLPIGLYHLWHEKYRMHWLMKVFISVAASAVTVCIFVGVLSLFARPNPVMAQTNSAVLAQRDIYPLLVDPDGGHYHMEGCVYADPEALPITLVQAARQSIPADELCNPPRYNNRN